MTSPVDTMDPKLMFRNDGNEGSCWAYDRIRHHQLRHHKKAPNPFSKQSRRSESAGSCQTANRSQTALDQNTTDQHPYHSPTRVTSSASVRSGTGSLQLRTLGVVRQATDNAVIRKASGGLLPVLVRKPAEEAITGSNSYRTNTHDVIPTNLQLPADDDGRRKRGRISFGNDVTSAIGERQKVISEQTTRDFVLLPDERNRAESVWSRTERMEALLKMISRRHPDTDRASILDPAVVLSVDKPVVIEPRLASRDGKQDLDADRAEGRQHGRELDLSGHSAAGRRQQSAKPTSGHELQSKATGQQGVKQAKKEHSNSDKRKPTRIERQADVIQTGTQHTNKVRGQSGREYSGRAGVVQPSSAQRSGGVLRRGPSLSTPSWLKKSFYDKDRESRVEISLDKVLDNKDKGTEDVEDIEQYRSQSVCDQLDGQQMGMVNRSGDFARFASGSDAWRTIPMQGELEQHLLWKNSKKGRNFSFAKYVGAILPGQARRGGPISRPRSHKGKHTK